MSHIIAHILIHVIFHHAPFTGYIPISHEKERNDQKQVDDKKICMERID